VTALPPSLETVAPIVAVVAVMSVTVGESTVGTPALVVKDSSVPE
jgi:hypothetical protein